MIVESITVPNKTPSRAPYKIEVKPLVRVLYGIDILFPSGCLGAVGIRFLDWGSQFAPLGVGWFSDNDKLVTWRGFKYLSGPPYIIQVETYNHAVDYNHTLEVRFDVRQF